MDAPIATLMANAFIKGYAAQAEKEEREQKRPDDHSVEVKVEEREVIA